MQSQGTRKSNFPGQTTVPSGSTFDYVSSGVNYKITADDLINAFGLTGSIVQVGDSACVPVLDDQGLVKGIRNIRPGFGIAAIIDPTECIEISTNFSFNETGVALVNDPLASAVEFRSLVAARGIGITGAPDEITIENTSPAALNQIMVAELADFPTPSAGVITLADDTCYRLSAAIDVGSNRFVTGSNTIFCGGSSLIDSVTSSSAGALFTGTDNFTVQGVSLNIPNGDVFSLSGTSVENLIVRNVRTGAAQSLGTITDFGLTVLAESGFFNLTLGGLSFVGSHGRFSITEATIVNAAGSGIDLGTATFNTIYIGTNVTLFSASGATCLAIAPNSANINVGGRGVVLGNAFRGPGTHISGADDGDLLWERAANQGITDTRSSGQGYIQGSVLNTSFGVLNTPVIVNYSTDFLSDIEKRFTISTAGRFTYIGEDDIEILLDATVFARITGGASRVYNYYIAKNGVTITSSISSAEYDGSNPGSNSVTSLVELTKDDYVELWVEAETALTDLNVENTSMKVRAQ